MHRLDDLKNDKLGNEIENFLTILKDRKDLEGLSVNYVCVCVCVCVQMSS